VRNTVKAMVRLHSFECRPEITIVPTDY
jgi:hypothetical protein